MRNHDWRNRAWGWVVVLCLALAPGALAQEDDDGSGETEMAAEIDIPWPKDASIAQYRALVMAAAAPVHARAIEKEAQEVEEQAQDVVEKAPGTVGAADGFGSKLGETLTNFLPLFGFAVDAVNVSDDEKAVIVDFNPLRVADFGAIKLNATIAEPLPAKALVEAVEQSAREAQEKAIQGTLGDFDDITWTLTYGYQRPMAPAAITSGPRRTWYWGRHPQLYEPLIKQLMDEVWKAAIPTEEASEGFGSVYEVPISELLPAELIARGVANLTRSQLPPDRVEEIRRLIVLEAVGEAKVNERLADLDLEKIGHMIDNQPQLVATAAYRERDERIGANALSASLKVELGANNLNSLLRESRRGGRSLLQAYENAIANWDVLSKDRFTFSLTYLERDEHEMSLAYDLVAVDPQSGEETRFPRVAAIDLQGATELHGKVEYSRAIKRQAVQIEGESIFPRVDFTSEYVDVDDDPTRQDRWTAQLAFNFPVRGGLSIPLTLSWANHAEFLGEADDQLGAHLGISYGLDRLFEAR